MVSVRILVFCSVAASAPFAPADGQLASRAFESGNVPPRSDTEPAKKLTPEQKETIRQWIEQGAAYQKHWAFEAPVAAALPTVKEPVKQESWLQ